MSPFLREGDVLEVVPYDGASVQRGDVIVYDPPGYRLTVVHRVVCIGLEGIRTRGDANCSKDPYLLTTANIKGRVVLVRRAQGQFCLYPGARGMVQGYLGKLKQHACSLLIHLFNPLCQMLLHASRLKRHALMELRPQLLCFNRAGGIEFQLAVGRCVIAKRPAGDNRWQIRHRHRFLVDERLLLDWLR